MKTTLELAHYIDVVDIPKDWIDYYEVALDSFDASWFSGLDEIITFYQFDVELKAKLEELFYLIIGDINLIFLVYLWYYILYEAKTDKHNKWNTNPSYFKSNGDSYMPIMAMLMGYKRHEETTKNYSLEQKEIQKKIIRDIYTSDLVNYNYDGVRFSTMEWGSRFIRGQIIQIGIFQYELKRNFYHGEDVIFIHIPARVNLTKENIEESFKMKSKVFDYFDVPHNIKFVTETWLLSPELKNILKPTSNILLFQSYFDIIEYIENDKDFLKFVFKEPFEVNDFDLLKEDTSLQKSLKEKLKHSEKLHISLGILK